MHRYVEFNAAKFLNDSREWEREKANLKTELDSISGIKGVHEVPARSGKIGDSVPHDAMDRSRIQARINRLDLYQSALTYGWNQLSEEQREVLTVFFYTSGWKSRLVRQYGEKHGLGIKLVYTERRKALNELSRIISRRYNL